MYDKCDQCPTITVHIPQNLQNKKVTLSLWTQARNNLDASSLIMIEDDQQNLEVVYAEQPTSMAYSSDKLTAAVYPICVEFLAEINGQQHIQQECPSG